MVCSWMNCHHGKLISRILILIYFPHNGDCAPLGGICYTEPMIFFVMLCFAGAILSVGGFMSFMLTGSIAAIRFGVILGGTLLAFSISSLRSWRKGESSSLALKGQTGMFLMVPFWPSDIF